MAFAIAVNNLIEAMKKPGCPACRIHRQAAERALVSFLWENVNEPDIRQGILDSYGFCLDHARVMVAQELLSSSIPLGTNIVYEHLGRVVAKKLRSIRPSPLTSSFGGLSSFLSRARKLFARVVSLEKQGPLKTRGACPACEAGDRAVTNSMHVLCEEIQNKTDVVAVYLNSSGLCFAHLRFVIDVYSGLFPNVVAFLIDTSASRLENQSRDMKEFLRKHNWSYRDEKLTEAEDTAWRKTLGFFTGLPESTFSHKTDDFE